jgi:CRP-like cAMP-binding protein
VEHFFMIRKGEVEVVLQDEENGDVVISQLKPGEFFGEIELMSNGLSIAHVLAGSHGPVEVLLLHRNDFMRVINQSPITAEALEKIVQQRLEEHRTVDPRKETLDFPRRM